MAKTNDILYNYGITDNQLVQLYRYDLLNVLSDVPGIGCGRIAELERELSQMHGPTRLPQHYAWIYKLAIDVLKIPTGQSFYGPSRSGQPTLDSFKKIDPGISNAVNEWLNTALPKREQALILQLYRDGKTPHDAARHFGLSYQYLTKLKSGALRKLQSPRYAQALRNLICD